MNRNILFITSIILILLLIASCSKGKDPVTPGVQTDGNDPGVPNLTQAETSTPHNLLGYWLIEYDPETDTVEKIPVRMAENHFNVRKPLEEGSCDNCVEVKHLNVYPGGDHSFEVIIRNPYYPDIIPMGFDCRGIVMFNGSRTFTDSGHTTPVRAMGDGELLNADGYTALYNGTTIGHGLLGYSKGNFATQTIPNSTVNGYKRHSSYGSPGSGRNAITSASSNYYGIVFPTDGPFVFGYAVDVSWYPPDNPPGNDPEDYPISANAPEPWLLDVELNNYGEPLNETGGQTEVQVEVWDWDGEFHTPTIECPELFDGVREFEPYSPGSTWYEVVIENENHAPAGTYRCLIKVGDPSDATSPPWMDQNAYQIVDVIVDPAPGIFLKDVTPEWLNIAPWDIDIKGDYAFIASGGHGLHIFNISNPDDLQWVKRVPLQYDTTVSYFDSLVSLDIVGDYAFGVLIEEGIVVFDISDPISTHIISQIPIDYPVRAYDIAVEGEIAYIAGEYSLIAMDIFPPGEAHELGRIELNDLARNVVIDGSYAYVSKYFHGVDVIDISDPSSMGLLTTILPNGEAYSMEIVGDYLYYGDGSGGLSVADISTPESAITVGNANHTQGGYCTDVTIVNDVAIVAEEDTILDPSLTNGVSFYNVTDPTSPQYLTTILDDRPCSKIVASGGYAFAAGVDTGLYSIDIDPISTPALADEHLSFNFIRDVAYENGKLYAASSEPGFFIIDVTVPEQAYTEHFEKVEATAFSLDVENGTAYVGGKNWLMVYDVDPPETTSLITQHLMYERVNKILVDDNIAYFIDRAFGTYVNRFLIWDMTDPLNPIEHFVDDEIYNTDYYDFWKSNDQFVLAQGRVHTNALFFYDIDPLDATWREKEIDHTMDSTVQFYAGMAIKDGVYFTNYTHQVMQSADIETGDILGTLDLGGTSIDMDIVGNYAFCACGVDGVRVADISDPANMSMVDWMPTRGIAYDMEIEGNMIYIADYYGGVRLIEIQ